MSVVSNTIPEQSLRTARLGKHCNSLSAGSVQVGAEDHESSPPNARVDWLCKAGNSLVQANVHGNGTYFGVSGCYSAALPCQKSRPELPLARFLQMLPACSFRVCVTWSARDGLTRFPVACFGREDAGALKGLAENGRHRPQHAFRSTWR